MLRPSPLTLSLSLVTLFTFISALYMQVSSTMIMMDWLIGHISYFPLNLTIILDPQGLLLCSVVTFITINVLGFSNTYMSQDLFVPRFKPILMLFVLSMNLLILIPNMAALILGWDGLGLTSFLLVAYYTNAKSLSSAMLTALTNRVGDALLLISASFLVDENHWTINFLWDSNAPALVSLLILLTACTKSAQFPFSSWLPAAMAAPTPVSALVHSSTLVTAGVFLLIRFYPFLSTFKLFHPTLAAMGCMTMVMAGMAASAETDLKKIVAFSTLSQLGFMMGTISAGAPQIAFFHVTTHALVKALLFLCAGTVIHFNSHNQDIRLLGMMSKMPLTTSCFVLSSGALYGTPFLAMYYSKDLILHQMLQAPMNLLTTLAFYLATSLTAAYTARMLCWTLFFPANFAPLNPLNEDKMVSPYPLSMLALASLIGGATIWWLFIPLSYSTPLSPTFMLMPIISTAAGWYFMSLHLYFFSPFNLNPFPQLNNFVSSMWFMTHISSQMMITPTLKTSFILTHSIDNGWQEMLGGQGAHISSYTLNKYITPATNNPAPSALLLISMLLLFTLTL